MRVLIVEDEYLLAEELEEHLVNLDNRITVLGKLGSIEETVAWLIENSCDLLFLDIQLNDGLSFSIFEKVDVNCPVIFTTAYDEYAIKAFDVNSIAYLLKPIDEEDLEKALTKYEMLQKRSNNDSLEHLLRYIQKEKMEYLERITLSLGKIQKPVKVTEIAYFMAEGRLVFAITKDEKRYFYEKTLYQLEEELNPKYFFRANRSFIINYDSVMEVVAHTKGRVLLKLNPATKEKVMVSKERTKELNQWLRQ